MKRHIIITSSDGKYGDFLINHWLRSLEANVDLTNIDLAVIDYGLSIDHRNILEERGVNIIRGSTGGHVVTLRFEDATIFLKKTSYDQILFIDGGDVVYQADISHVFEENKESFRVVPLDMEVMFFEAFIPKNFSPLLQKELWKALKGKPVLNAGVIFAPRDKFIYLCNQVNKLVREKFKYGPDQIIVNYVIYRDKMVLLNKKYNFIMGTEREGFVIKDGIFYRKNGEKIVIAHNAGHDAFLRPIHNFGYGKGHNQLKYFVYYSRRIIFVLFRIFRILQHYFNQ